MSEGQTEFICCWTTEYTIKLESILIIFGVWIGEFWEDFGLSEVNRSFVANLSGTGFCWFGPSLPGR